MSKYYLKQREIHYLPAVDMKAWVKPRLNDHIETTLDASNQNSSIVMLSSMLNLSEAVGQHPSPTSGRATLPLNTTLH